MDSINEAAVVASEGGGPHDFCALLQQSRTSRHSDVLLSHDLLATFLPKTQAKELFNIIWLLIYNI